MVCSKKINYLFRNYDLFVRKYDLSQEIKLLASEYDLFVTRRKLHSCFEQMNLLMRNISFIHVGRDCGGTESSSDVIQPESAQLHIILLMTKSIRSIVPKLQIIAHVGKKLTGQAFHC